MKIGVADTCFARVDMGRIAVQTINEACQAEIERYTVPGFKDLPVAAKKLIEEYGCDIVLAFGWIGDQQIDERCAHEASLGIIQAQLMTNKHILSCFVHSLESDDPEQLKEIAHDRARKHALNAIELAKSKTALTPQAGMGKRQGSEDAGPLQCLR